MSFGSLVFPPQLPSVMKRKQNIEPLVESLAQQNKTVSRTVDGIVEVVSSLPGARQRSDWSEIQKTSELIVVQDLVFGQDEGEDEPHPTKPKKMSDTRNRPFGANQE